jgi:hypothetical protein
MLIANFRFVKGQTVEQLSPERNQSVLIGQVNQSLYMENIDSIVCTDIIFALLNDAFNVTEPIVHGFTIEAAKLNLDVDKRKEKERIEVIGRACQAKESTIELLQEIKNKQELLD